MHHRAASALEEYDTPEAHDRRAHHLTAVGEVDLAAAELTRAAEQWRGEHALLAAERAARTGRRLARLPGSTGRYRRRSRGDARRARSLVRSPHARRRHGRRARRHAARRLRRAVCELEGGRPDAAEAIVNDGLRNGDRDVQLLLVLGQASLVGGDADRALSSARDVLTRTDGRLDERLAAFELRGARARLPRRPRGRPRRMGTSGAGCGRSRPGPGAVARRGPAGPPRVADRGTADERAGGRGAGAGGGFSCRADTGRGEPRRRTRAPWWNCGGAIGHRPRDRAVHGPAPRSSTVPTGSAGSYSQLHGGIGRA